MTHPIALSTLAMTLYNALALSRRTLDYADLMAHPVVVQQHGPVDRALAETALAELTKRGWVKIDCGSAAYRVADQAFRLCIKRNKLDAVEDPDTGVVSGGWHGWTLQDNTPIEEVTR